MEKVKNILGDYYLSKLESGWQDTRDENYCWRVRDGDGNIVAHYTMDWSAQIYQFGKPEGESISIVSWAD